MARFAAENRVCSNTDARKAAGAFATGDTAFAEPGIAPSSIDEQQRPGSPSSEWSLPARSLATSRPGSTGPASTAYVSHIGRAMRKESARRASTAAQRLTGLLEDAT